MIRCIGNIREGGDGRYYVTCRGSEGHINPFYTDLDGDLGCDIAQSERGEAARRFVNEWVAKNCSAKAEVFGNATMAFHDDGDAGLFWMTFKSDKPLA
jgi:hypothetical protein